MEICFATNNENKLAEVQKMLPDTIKLKTLAQIGCTAELPETQDTLEGNARQKAQYVFEHFEINCFADDTGLEVYALNNEPGVYSARYAGEQRNNQDNINLLLQNLEGQTDRKARFRTVVALVLDGEYFDFEGIVEGEIITEQRGTNGFGYDAVFVPNGYTQTFAEISPEEKNKISHRGQAIAKLVAYLSEKFGTVY
ncbi:non-canonical purine NTP diphosphatase [Adhaeribacter sp. BT258]|uniref:dITP/XTP pyrophosphatase n=1 Tax=Adhaeribacter terrigena TaxID=2793070 RepID=A0ABS1BWL6_9BACT|nr:non-canonical purine NTP diphosphatase [Adhaeribacter terrigena]MBK0401515.1 non-canonical purine NTP diphosphatase [Adhaeribacter terrigena]